MFGGSLVDPGIDDRDLLVVDPQEQASAVVRSAIKSIRFTELGLDGAEPARREMVGADAGVRGTAAPIEVHNGIGPDESGCAGEGSAGQGIGPVLTDQPRAVP